MAEIRNRRQSGITRPSLWEAGAHDRNIRAFWEEAIRGTGREPGLPRQFLPQTIRPVKHPVKLIRAKVSAHANSWLRGSS